MVTIAFQLVMSSSEGAIDIHTLDNGFRGGGLLYAD
jgi:hypothetical protein